MKKYLTLYNPQMIDFDRFLHWCESRFGDVVVKGDEIKINSIFEEDYKHHMWCSPKGGKKEHRGGVYHCWKSGKKGSLVNLVRQVDKCTYDEALEKLGAGAYELMELEERLEAFMASRTPTTIEELQNVEVLPGLKFPEQTFPILSLSPDNFWRIEAEVYLSNRKLDPKDYLICMGGDYKNRIIIPYYDSDAKLIYWNARFLGDNDSIPKYLGPHKDQGVGKGDVIYIAGGENGWPPPKSKLYLTEGEFDAKSLSNCGYYAGAIGGKAIEDKQISLLQDYIPVLCFDTDSGKGKDAGGEALVIIGEQLREKGINEIYFVRPPKQYKDWNKFFQVHGRKLINAYINQNEKPYTPDTKIELLMKGI